MVLYLKRGYCFWGLKNTEKENFFISLCKRLKRHIQTLLRSQERRILIDILAFIEIVTLSLYLSSVFYSCFTSFDI